MTFASAGRLALEIVIPISSAIVAGLLVGERDWRGAIPVLLMASLVSKLERVESPQLFLLAAAITAWVVLVVARGGNRRLSLAAIVICALCSGILQVSHQLALMP
jgi:hypothetical protein